MRKQLRIVYPVTIAIFAVLFPSCINSCTASSRPHSSVDIYVSTFFDLNPPIVCPCDTCQGRLLQSSSPSIFSLETQNPERIAEAILAPDSPFRGLAGYETSTFVRQLEKDLTERNSFNDANSRRSGSDTSAVDLVESASTLLFGGASSNPETLSLLKKSFVPVDASKDGQESDMLHGSMFPQLAMLGRYTGFHLLSKLWGYIGSSEIILCIVSEIIRTQQNPENLGSIACQCAQKCSGTEGVCEIASLLSTGLACSGLVKCSSKPPRPYIPPIDTRYVNLPLTPILPTPQEMHKSVIHKEIHTYYLLCKSVALLTYEAIEASCDPMFNSSSTLPGWHVEMTANLVERKPDEKKDRVPFARLSSRKNAQFPSLTDYLITVRGTLTAGEWGIDFSYNQIFDDLTELGSVPIHRGFADLAASVWAPFQLRLQEDFNHGHLGLITITGHSLGGGVASVLGHLALKQFPTFLEEKHPTVMPRVRVVTFGGGRAGGHLLWEYDASRVVTRTIEALFDPVPQIPCNDMRGCPADLVPVPTARDLHTSFSYAQARGVVPIHPHDLTPDFTSGAFPNLYIPAWHVCSYDCWTSRHADPHHASSCYSPDQFSKRHPSEICPFLPSKYETTSEP